MKLLRLSLCVLSLALPWAPSLLSGARSSADSPRFDVHDAPTGLVGMERAADLELEEDVLQEIRPSGYVMRNYVGAGSGVEL
jgi:hypothetical protein